MRFERRSMVQGGIAVVLPALMLSAAVAGAQTVADGQIAGRITDTRNAVLPGVTVRISGNGLSRAAVTDNDGRFVLDALPPARYEVRTELAGFRSQSGEIVLSPAQPRAYLAWSLGLGCLVADITVIEGLRDLARRVDDVVHVRVVSSDGRSCGPCVPNATVKCCRSTPSTSWAVRRGPVDRGPRQSDFRSSPHGVGSRWDWSPARSTWHFSGRPAGSHGPGVTLQ